MKTLYDFQAQRTDGTVLDMNALAGKVVLIVNTATKCGLASQFEGLEALHQQYREAGLVVLGFPCDQFAHQEPEEDQNMAAVCQLNHGVTFTLMAKCQVNGPDTHPIYKYLKENLNGFLGSRIKWNFTKFLIDNRGIPVKRFGPTTKPARLEADIRSLLGE